MKFATASFLILSMTVLVSCHQRGSSSVGDSAVVSAGAQSNDAIRTAIQAHLAHNGNLNLKSFDTEIKQVTFAGDQANVEVEFHVKNGSGTMQLTYALARRDGVWSVVESTPGGSNFSHPTLDKTLPPQAGGPVAGEPAIFRALDNFHGRAAKSPQNLPPGHPAIAATPRDETATP